MVPHLLCRVAIFSIFLMFSGKDILVKRPLQDFFSPVPAFCRAGARVRYFFI
jgi:hypothetical protein